MFLQHWSSSSSAHSTQHARLRKQCCDDGAYAQRSSTVDVAQSSALACISCSLACLVLMRADCCTTWILLMALPWVHTAVQPCASWCSKRSKKHMMDRGGPSGGRDSATPAGQAAHQQSGVDITTETVSAAACLITAHWVSLVGVSCWSLRTNTSLLTRTKC